MPQSSTYQHLESLIKEFELRWQQSPRPDIADYLHRYPENPLELLIELSHVDMELRFTHGERARARDYLDRFEHYREHPEQAADLIRAEFDFLKRLGKATEWNTWSEQYAEYREYLPVELDTTSVFRSSSHKTVELPQNYLPTIPEYELQEELGRGGMGIVYRARHVELNRLVAIKTLRSGSMATATERERFQREAEAIAKLDHPNIVPIYRVGSWKMPGTDVEIPYFVMKYYSGGSLETLKTRAPLDFQRICHLTETIADAVHHAHQRGILHRDLKPSNILLDEAGEPHVADLGLASQLDSDHSSLNSFTIVGTPAYMAPEQAFQPRQVTTAADVYGLGAVLYQLLTRQAPFTGDSSFKLFQEMLESAPQRPKKLRAEVPADLETICLKCLEKEPARRFGSARELAEDLRRWRNGYPITARTITVFERTCRLVQRHPFFSGLLILTLLILGFGLISLSLSNQALTEQERQTAIALSAAKTLNQELRETISREQQQLYLERIGSAGRLWESNQVSQAWALLDACPSSLRSWEWHYLDSLRQSGPRRLMGHQDAVMACQFLDNNQFITADNRDVLCLWKVGKENPVATWRDSTVRQIKSINAVTAHAPENWVATVDVDSIAVWNLSTKLKEHQLEGKHWICHSPDGHWLASGFDNEVRVWDSRTWKLVQKLTGHQQMLLSGQFTPDGKYLLTSSLDRTIRRWNVNTGELVNQWQHPIPVTSFAIVQQGRTVIEAFAGFLLLVDISTGQTLRRIELPLTARTPIAIHPDGEQIAVATAQSEIRCIHLSKAAMNRTLRGHALPIFDLAYSPDGRQLISVGADSSVYFWNLDNQRDGEIHYSLDSDFQRILVAPEKYMALVQIQPTATVQQMRTMDYHSATPLVELPGRMPACFTKDGTGIVATVPEGLTLTECGTGKRLRSWNLSDVQPRVICCCPSTGHLAIGTFEGKILLIDPDKDGLVHQWNPGLGPILSLCYHSQGKQLAINGSLFTAVWNLASKEEICRLKMRHNTVKVLVDPQSRWLLTLDNDRSIRRHDIRTGQMIDTVASSAARISDFAIHPSATRLVTRSIDGDIKIWHLDYGRELLKLHGDEYPFGTVFWDASGETLYSTDRALRSWSITSRK